MNRTALTGVAAAVILAVSGCGGATAGNIGQAPSTAAVQTTTDMRSDLVVWWSSVEPDLTKMTKDLSALSGAGDDNAAATRVLNDVNALQADPPMPGSAPVAQRGHWKNTLADISSAMIYVQSGDYPSATVRINQGTNEINQLGAYFATLG